MLGSSNKLAIHGGAPVRSDPMPLRRALGNTETAMIQEVLAYYSSTGADPGYQGIFEERYCQAFVDSQGGGYADAVATGTVSLFVALKALELPQGGEVLVSPITDPGSLSAIILNGLVPRLADSAPGKFNMEAAQVEARLGDDTCCILAVHAAGQATDIDAIVDLAHNKGIKVLEDCSQAHGAKWKGRPVGTFGDIAAFSTMYRKAHMTGASGGIVYTADKDLYHMALAHADRGKPRWSDDFDDRDPSNYLFPALNLHTDEISCGMGIASLARLPETIDRRLAYLKGVTKALIERSEVCRPNGCGDGDSPFYYPIFIEQERIRCSKREFANAVLEEGIDLNPHYQYLVAGWNWIQSYLADDFGCPNAVAARDASFCLYVNEKYGQREIDDTIEAILKVEKYYVDT